MSPSRNRSASRLASSPRLPVRLALAFVAGAAVATAVAWAAWPTRSVSVQANDARPAAPAPLGTGGASVIVEGKAGPWGRLEYTPITIAPPRDLIDIGREISPTRWTFRGHTRRQVEQILRVAGLGDAELAALAASQWSVSGSTTSVVAPAELILNLHPDVRAALYSILARYPENVHNASRSFDPGTLDQHVAGAGLSPATVALFRRLLYPRGEVVMFADDRTLLPMIENNEERARMVLLLARQETYAVRLKVDSSTDLTALVQYWGKPGRSKDIEPIISSLAAVPGGYALDLAHLLPSMPRRRVYTYPRPDRPGDEAKNCHWTSLNFFNETLDDRFVDVQAARLEVEAHYRRVDEPTFGDLIVLADRETGTVVHSAIYLADDLVFTKNGFGFGEPWQYMRLGPMAELYSQQLGRRGAIKILIYRRHNARA